MTIRRSTVEQIFGTLKYWTGPANFPGGTLRRASTGITLLALAYNLKRIIEMFGVAETWQAMTMAGS
ncbi:hypothetical protein [Paraburkholderia graminis]